MNYNEEPRLKLIYEILGKKIRSSQAFTQYINANREYGQGEVLHMREAHFIVQVGPGEGLTMSEIAERLCVTLGAVSQTAGRLEKKGYILRKRASGNHRQIIAILTPMGETFYQQHLQYDSVRFAFLDANYFSRFTEEQLCLIRDYEALMYTAFTKENIKP